MLNAFCIDPAIGQPPDAMSVGQIVSKVVSNVYKAKAHSSANLFKYNDPVINEALKESGLDKELGEDWFERATWWEVVDKLFAKNIFMLRRLLSVMLCQLFTILLLNYKLNHLKPIR